MWNNVYIPLQWLRDKAKPLIVQREKVWAALIWLKLNNPLYANIIIDHDYLTGLDREFVAPVKINFQKKFDRSFVGSSYDSVIVNAEDTETQDCNVYSSVVVTDIDGKDVSSSEMTGAVFQHLKCGSRFLQLSHGHEPSNDYTDFNLFPLLYPMLCWMQMGLCLCKKYKKKLAKKDRLFLHFKKIKNYKRNLNLPYFWLREIKEMCKIRYFIFF